MYRNSEDDIKFGIHPIKGTYQDYNLVLGEVFRPILDVTGSPHILRSTKGHVIG